MSGTTAGYASKLDPDTHCIWRLAGLDSRLFQSVFLSSVVYHSLRLVVIFRTGGQIDIVVYREPILHM